VDLELAALLDEEAAEPAGVRGDGSPSRTALRFEVEGGTTIELDLDAGRLRGQVIPLGPTAAVLEHLVGEASRADVDTLGRFAFEQPVPGTARIRLERPTGRPLATDWFVL
jgi:hypothetical protein